MKTKPKPIPALVAWAEVATVDELQKLAKLADASYDYLRNLLIPGRRCISSEFAARLEEAAAILRAANPALPPLKRADLSPTCAACPMAKRCGGGA